MIKYEKSTSNIYNIKQKKNYYSNDKEELTTTKQN